MFPVNNLINQNLTDPSRTSAGQIAVGQQAEALQATPSRAPGLRTGTVVTGRVLAGNSEVVAETGGRLSHAAIVAREYGIPAVLGVPGATVRIADNARISVDGTAGRVADLS